LGPGNLVIDGGVDLSPDPTILDLVKAVFSEYRGSFDRWGVALGREKVYEDAKDEKGQYLKKVRLCITTRTCGEH